jgi:hypothetical protein
MRHLHLARNTAFLGVALSISALIAGCAGGSGGSGGSERSAGSGRDDLAAQRETGAALFANPRDAGRTTDREPAWSVVIAAFRGPDRDRNAGLWLDRVRTVGGLPEARLEQRSEGVLTLAVGRFDAPEDPEAQRTLGRVRATEVDGRRPFAGAFLAPPVLDAEQGPMAELDLRNARALHGPAAQYTLQIAVYDPGPSPSTRDRREVRRTAEEAAVQLRQEGEMAFFFHGPNTSSVTIGILTERDIAGVFGVGPAVRELRERHPDMLVNGQTMRRPGGSMIPTEVVRVPD